MAATDPRRTAVIVATARTPIGRAGKGSLVEFRPDDLAALAIRSALAKVPQLDPTTLDDVYLGCGLPGGESGFNMARVVNVLNGMDGIPGATVNRYCSSSIQTTRMASRMMAPLIFETPLVRSMKVMGTSAMRKPACHAECFISTRKE